MRQRLLRFLIPFAVLVGVMGAASADAAALRTGATRFVRVTRLRDGKLTVALTARGRRTFRHDLRGGRVLYTVCVRLGETLQGETVGKVTFPGSMSFGIAGAKRYRPLVDARADFCDLNLARVTKASRHARISLVDRPPLDAVALTERGAEYLQEDRIAARSWTILLAARLDTTFEPGGRFPSARVLVSSLRRVGGYGRVVVLGDPTMSPSSGTTGIYSDGDAHLEIVTMSAARKRLFVDQNGSVYSTNIQDHIDRFLDSKLPDPFG